jgi:hypothetical protein
MASRLCLFCPKPLSPNTSPEHILLDALGGRATTRMVICSECNHLFGSTIDNSFTRQIEPLRTLLNLRSGSKKPPPGQRYKSAAGEQYTVRPDGNVSRHAKPLTFESGLNGVIKVHLNVETLDEVNAFIPHIAAKTGVSEDQVRRQMEATEASRVSQAAPPFTTDLSFGGSEALRSVIKSCLVLCASKTNLETARGGGFAAARNFVTGGDEDFLHNRITLEDREIPGVERLISDYGPIFNLIFCKSDGNGRMIAYYGLYNTAYWNVVLAEQGAVPNRCFGMVSDPTENGRWKHFDAKTFDLEVTWMASPILGGGDRIGRSLAIAFKQRDQTKRDGHLELLIHEAMQDCGIKYGDRITDEFVNRFSLKVAFWFSKMRYEERLTSEQIKEAFQRKGSFP